MKLTHTKMPQIQSIQMQAHQHFGYRLTSFEQPPDAWNDIQSFTADYIHRYQLFREVEHYTTIIGTFVRFCLPKAISIRGLKVICLFTTLCFFIDDCADKENNDYLAQYRELITGIRRPTKPSEKALNELLNLTEALSVVNNMSTKRFRQQFLNYLKAQQWERDFLKRANRGFNLNEYQRYRPDAIAAFPYFALLKLAKNIDEQRFHPLQSSRLLFLEQLSARIAYLDNDILSWQTECNEPTALNLVKVFIETLALSWHDSLERVLELRNATVELYIHNRDEALKEGVTPEPKDYCELIECTVTGNFEAMKRLKLHHLRYELDANLVT